MTQETLPKDHPAAVWNGASGAAWVEMQDALDAMFAPFVPLLLERALTPHTRRVLDVGCGAGATTLAAARALGVRGSCVGVDVSAPLIDAANRRAGNARQGSVRFVLADAQRHAFAPGSFDALISRFGVMFFDDPVAAFRNLRGAMRGDGRLVFAAWRAPDENPFMTQAARAAASLLPSVTPPDPQAPGQWAFADATRVKRILAASGWSDIAVEPIDIPCTVPIADLDAYVTRLGPVGAALREADEHTRAQVASAVRPAFERYVQGPSAQFIAACWIVTAVIKPAS